MREDEILKKKGAIFDILARQEELRVELMKLDEIKQKLLAELNMLIANEGRDA